MNILHDLEKIEIIQKRADIEVLCRKLFNYMQDLVREGKSPLVFDRFVLVRAIEELFFPALVSISGYNLFMGAHEKMDQGADLLFCPHHWLAVDGDDRYLIDVLPCDGEFGVSIPQLIIQNHSYKRFVPAGSMYPGHWGKGEKEQFSGQVSVLVEIFEQM
jgi:hypothetical protein